METRVKQEVDFGKLYGRWIILQDAGMAKNSQRMYYVQCLCGNLGKVRRTALLSGEAISCGCYHKEVVAKSCGNNFRTHGLSKHPLHEVWANMISRCSYVNNEAYCDYGARGIKICNEWLSDFKSFYDWCMANGWRKGLQIDRIDNNAEYKSSNCRFVTTAINNRNRRSTKLNQTSVDKIREAYRISKGAKKLATEYGVSVSTIKDVVGNRTWV